MYKIVMIDLDGTLLDDNKQVSSRNIEMINKIHKEKNVIFVITTGKNLKDINYILEAIGEGINQYIITSNGAVVKDNKNNQYILERYLTEEEIIHIIDIYKTYPIHGLLQTQQGPISEDEAAKEVGFATYVADLKGYVSSNPISNIPLMTLKGKKSDLVILKKTLENQMDTIEATEICDFTQNHDGKIYTIQYIDVMKKNATKANGIKILIDYLKIKKEEVVAIGDGGNDIPMFEMAGYKVVMENANEYVKSKADYITDTNNKDGVAKALEYLFYKGEGKNEK